MPTSENKPERSIVATGKSHDVVGIGNALVDVITTVSDEYLHELELVAGSMNLIDQERFDVLFGRSTNGLKTSGGSAANTIAGVALCGGKGTYLGRVRNDDLGDAFRAEIVDVGVDFPNESATTGPTTGTCLIMVTNDGQRTLNTFLGASELFSVENVDADAIANAKILYMEGYLYDRPEAQEAFAHAAEVAHQHETMVSVTLSDSFCVDRHRAKFLELISSHVDLVFSNEDELLSLFETNDLDDALGKMSSVCPLAVVTRSEHGSVVLSGGERVSVPAVPVDQVVDTTGAGDLYAAGFLFGFTRGLEHLECARYGSIAAAEVIAHVGPRPLVNLASLLD